MINPKKNLVGEKFGLLSVERQAEDYVTSKGEHKVAWWCKCDCGNPNEIYVLGSNLSHTKPHTTSCGCEQKRKASKALSSSNLKPNPYFEENGVIIGITYNTQELFFIDKKNFNKIKDICWYVGNKGYLRGRVPNGKMVSLHNFLFGLYCDHINRNKLDNREENIRKASVSENNRNKNLYRNNSSGFTGVRWNTLTQKWQSYIRKDKTVLQLGFFASKEEAIIARLKAEKEIYKEFAPQRHLFKEYNI